MSEVNEKPAEVIRQTMEEQLARIRTALDDRNLSKVAAATGLHENTVRNIARGRGEAPSLATIEKIGNYLFS
jgi:transcriptional regulator with XRE-family HTH domain